MRTRASLSESSVETNLTHMLQVFKYFQDPSVEDVYRVKDPSKLF